MIQSNLKNKFNVYQTPLSKIKDQSENGVIAIFDASGSMSSYWTHEVNLWNQVVRTLQNVSIITFGTNAKVENQSVLDPDYKKYSAGGTEIVKAFECLLQLFKNKKIPENVTILFLSDGEDNNASTCLQRLSKLNDQFAILRKQHKISFICVGVGSRFPTFLGMQLREYLHSGDESIPTVFQVDTNNYIESYTEQFEIIKENLVQQDTLKLERPLTLFPWEPSTFSNELYSGQYIAVSNEIDQIVFLLDDGSKKVIKPVPEVIGSMVVDISKAWIQKLQLKSIKNSVKDQALMAIQSIRELEQMIDTQEMNMGKYEKQSVMKRVVQRNLQQQQWKQDLQILITALKELSESVTLSKLTPEEAAKRLAIGNRVGKYHQASMKFCGIDRNDYYLMRDEVVQLLMVTKFDLDKPEQERSVISLQCLKDILSEPDLVPALQLCPSQYDLVEVVPLVGVGLLIKRFDGMLVNPWLTQVFSVARHHSTVDTVGIYAAKDRILKLNTGSGDIEEINAVLPLLNDNNEEMIPFLRSRFFNILMTFNMLQNVDCCYDTSHASLSANLLLYLLEQPQSQWRDQLIQRIQYTFSIKYKDEEEFNLIKATMLSITPALSLVNSHPSLKHECQDPSKALIILLDLIKDHPALPNLNELVDRIIGEAIGRAYPTNEPLHKFIKYSQELLDKINSEIIVQNITEELKYNSPSDRNEFQSLINTKVIAYILNLQINLEVELNIESLGWLSYKYNFNCFNAIYKFFLNQDLSKENLTVLIYHAFLFPNSLRRNQNPIQRDSVLNKINDYILITLAPIKQINKQIFDNLKGLLANSNDESHKYITPISKRALIVYCSTNNIDIKLLKYHKNSNITHQACLCLDCPYYLQPMHYYRSHYNVIIIHSQIKSQISVRYSFYALVKQMRLQNFKEIYDFCLNKCKSGNIRKFAAKDEKYCQNLILHLQDVYEQIENE